MYSCWSLPMLWFWLQYHHDVHLEILIIAYGIHTYVMSMFYGLPYVLHAMQCNCWKTNVGIVLLAYSMLHFYWFASWWCNVWCLTRLETRTKESNRHASYTITFNCWINVYACKCEIATNLCLAWVWVRVWLLRPERLWTMLEQGKVRGNSDGGP